MRVQDEKVGEEYGHEEEQLVAGHGKRGGAYIRRVKAGNPAVYLPKEALWPHVRECTPLLFQAYSVQAACQQTLCGSIGERAKRPRPACLCASVRVRRLPHLRAPSNLLHSSRP